MSTLALNDFLREGFRPEQLKRMGAPAMILIILAMMVLPLPATALDLLFSFNIAISLMVVVASLYTTRPLDFSSFPTVLLVTTLLRLSLNVASTRVVLIHGHEGPDAAGKVIEAFSHFLVGGNFAVGIVVFVILMVINFVVITKGAGRIAEVAARFTLDAMPGKQMAIDADLNAGLINEAEAKKRRVETAQEAEFYGSMDGASKFVRGDAVAGILILFVNIIGGLAVGMLQHGLSFSDAAEKYVMLAIGDGLVAQIPALVISVAAGLVVARVGQGEDIGSQVSGQLFKSPQVLGISAAIMALMGMIPGMPNFAFLTFAALLGYGAFRIAQRLANPPAEVVDEAVSKATKEPDEASWADLKPVDAIALEIGYRLIPLVDTSSDGDLLRRVRAIRRKFTQDVGFLPPTIHIRDNLDLGANSYRILINGVAISESEAQPKHFLAIDPGNVTMKLPGTAGVDPAFGLPAYWIDTKYKEQAKLSGYTVVDAPTVVATHISHILLTHAAKVFGRTEMQELLDHFSKAHPKLIEELTPKILPLSVVQRVLQNLLDEGVHLRDMRTVVDTLLEWGSRTQSSADLTAAVRVALSASIVQQLSSGQDELGVMVLEPNLERILNQSNQNAAPEHWMIEPGLGDTLTTRCATEAGRMEAQGRSAVLLVPDRMRYPLARMLRRACPTLSILAHSEIPEARKITVCTVIGAQA
jgi:flagellar biosynthesis protein FlhA